MRRPDPPRAGADPVSVLLVLEPGTVDHLIGAVVSYQRQRRVDGLGLDLELGDLVSALAAARRCHARTSVDVEAETGQSDEKLLLRYREVAARLSISERHVQRLVTEGHLPRVRLGAASRVHTADLAEYTKHLREKAT